MNRTGQFFKVYSYYDIPVFERHKTEREREKMKKEIERRKRT
jgi:hypothetical protein